MNKVILILGAGSNIGTAVADRFAENGYKVVLAARTLSPGRTEDGRMNIQADLSEVENIVKVFETAEQAFGPPNVVIYNVANRLTTPPDDPLSVPLESLHQSRKSGLDCAYVAAKEALRGFRSLPAEVSKAFIYTGNTLNQIAIPGVLPFALAKVAAAMMIEYVANAYGKEGYRFYYADQRQPDGRPAGLERDGSAHADMYLQLAHEAKQSKWLVTFTKEEGRGDFVGVDFDGETRADYDRKFRRA